jgi:nucleoside-diphosphate-sugar epimerase
MRALIGHTGFVGQNLLRQSEFGSLFNSKNIDEIRGQTFDEIVCAATPAEKWKADADPAADLRAIARLTSALAKAKARRFVLVSTVDVYPVPRHVDEHTSIMPDSSAPYGRHRLRVEEVVREHFEHAIVIRLPALFGPGLKKNAIFDLLHTHQVDSIDARGIFQFYDMANLSRDIDVCVEYDIRLLNAATEPIAIADVARDLFGRTLRPATSPEGPCYDFRSVHAPLWGGHDGYLYSKGTILGSLAAFVQENQ